MPTVYVPNKSSHDFSPAKKFGDLKFLSEGNISTFATNHAFRKFSEKMKDSKAEDYLILTGLTMINDVAAVILYSKHGKVNLLIFDPRGKAPRYMLRTITGGE